MALIQVSWILSSPWVFASEGNPKVGQGLGLPLRVVPFIVVPESFLLPNSISIVKYSKSQVHELIHGVLGAHSYLVYFSPNAWSRLSNKMGVC